MVERNSAVVFRGSGRGEERPVAGPAFAPPVPTGNSDGPVYDCLPAAALERVRSLTERAGVSAGEKPLWQRDGRRLVICRPKPPARVRAYFMDWGFVFNAGGRSFLGNPLRSVYSRNCVYQNVTGWGAF
ncbi:MAG: hypothetical protein ACRD2E_01220 [Terriglobales bacterium]